MRIGSRGARPPFDREDPSTWEAVLEGVGAEPSGATGRPIGYAPVGKEEYRAGLVAGGLPAEFADLIDLITDGRNAHLVSGVQEALGRAPREVAEYARKAAGEGAWGRWSAPDPLSSTSG
ncbi:hypothetical protein OG689_00945 [Kitasatospora sp. NBC_00240]|uniref:hypothetical protein n=1 Tax=Kitasatospora sp. NBC_00240 TaxID=2903567 RepID=UPI00224DAC52|nr:hypothetical protein [Kitasatospora sp. NBC_00240]MCX5207901.1 hypothetical protein [Kitasatospora sp. NBC_00240]